MPSSRSPRALLVLSFAGMLSGNTVRGVAAAAAGGGGGGAGAGAGAGKSASAAAAAGTKGAGAGKATKTGAKNGTGTGAGAGTKTKGAGTGTGTGTGTGGANATGTGGGNGNGTGTGTGPARTPTTSPTPVTPTRGGSGNTTGSASSANITSTTSSSSSLSAGAVAGIVIGIVFVSVVLLALLAFIIWRRRTRRLEREQYAGAGDPAERRTLDDLAFGPVGKSGHESSSQRMSSALSPISLSSDGSYSQNRQSAFSFAQSAVSDRDTGPSPPSGDRWRYFAHGAPLPHHFAAPGVGQTPSQTQPPFPQTQTPSPPPSSGRAESVISLPNPYSRTSSVAPPARAGRDEFADVAEALGAFMLDPRRVTMTSISTATTQAASPGAPRSRMENSVATNMSGSPMGERMKQRLAEEREMEELGPSREAHMQAPSDEPPPRYTIGNPPFEMPVREKS